MTPLTMLKAACAVVGLLVFGYGVRIDDPTVRWVGIAFVAVAALLRFLKPRPPAGGAGPDDGVER